MASVRKTAAKKLVRLGRPSQVGPYIELIKTTPKGETVTVGNLATQAGFASHQAATYRKKSILSVSKSSKVSVTRGEDGFYLVLTGRAKQA